MYYDAYEICESCQGSGRHRFSGDPCEYCDGQGVFYDHQPEEDFLYDEPDDPMFDDPDEECPECGQSYVWDTDLGVAIPSCFCNKRKD